MNHRRRLIVGILALSAFVLAHASKGVRAVVSISHVVRRGSTTEETQIHVMRDHKYFLEVIRERLPEKPTCTEFVGVLPNENFERLMVLIKSDEFQKLHTDSTVTKEGTAWYAAVRLDETRFFAFGHKYRAPAELVKWFRETASLREVAPGNVPDSRICSVFSQDTADNWR